MPVASIDADFQDWLEAEEKRHPPERSLEDSYTIGIPGQYINANPRQFMNANPSPKQAPRSTPANAASPAANQPPKPQKPE